MPGSDSAKSAWASRPPERRLLPPRPLWPTTTASRSTCLTTSAATSGGTTPRTASPRPASPSGQRSTAASTPRPPHTRPRLEDLVDENDDLPFGVSFAEVLQCIGHLGQREATVDASGNLPSLAEFDDAVDVVHAEPYRQHSYLLAPASDQRTDQQELQDSSHRAAYGQISSS